MNDKRYGWLKHAVLLALGLPFAIPLVWMVVTSLRSDDLIFSDKLWPLLTKAQWWHYPAALKTVPFALYLKNTLVLCAFSVAGTTLSCSLVAYGFARLKFRGRNALFLVLVSTMILPAQVTMIPTFMLYTWLGWYGTYLPLIVPHFFAAAFFETNTRNSALRPRNFRRAN